MTSVIVGGARTPMGRLLGNLKDFPATQLGAVAIRAALERSGVAPEQVQYVVMGQVLQAGGGRGPAPPGGARARQPTAVPASAPHKTEPDRPRAARPPAQAHPA